METHQNSDWHVQVMKDPLFFFSLGFLNSTKRFLWHSFTGLTAPQTKVLADKAHVYMTSNGRISMAGLNGSNIEYFAQSVDAAVRGQL